MDFLELVQSRFSVLEYKEQCIEQEKLDKIIESALAAPTACNNQPQRILIINDDAGREKLSRVVPSRYFVPAAFLVCCDKSEAWQRPMDGKSSGEIDAAIVTTHMMLEATALGLGSIWVMYWESDKMKAEFELTDNIEPVALLIVGYKADTAAPKAGHLKSKTADEILL